MCNIDIFTIINWQVSIPVVTSGAGSDFDIDCFKFHTVSKQGNSKGKKKKEILLSDRGNYLLDVAFITSIRKL